MEPIDSKINLSSLFLKLFFFYTSIDSAISDGTCEIVLAGLEKLSIL